MLPASVSALPSGLLLISRLAKPWSPLISQWHYYMPFAYGFGLTRRSREPYTCHLLLLEPRSCLLIPRHPRHTYSRCRQILCGPPARPLLPAKIRISTFACLHTSAAMETYHAYVDAFNAQVGKSTFGRIFRLDGCGHVCFIANIRALLSLADMPNRRMKSSTLGLLQKFELGSLHSSLWRTSSLSMLVCEGPVSKTLLRD